MCKVGEKHKVTIAQLQAEKEKLLTTLSNLQSEVSLLTSKLEKMTKFIRMLNNGTDLLEEILLVGKGVGNLTGIGLNYKSLNKKEKPFGQRLFILKRRMIPRCQERSFDIL